MLTPPRRSLRPANRLLSSLPGEDLAHLRPYLRTILVSPKQTILTTGEPVRYVYFPNGGVYSILSTLSNGATIEVSALGDDGLAGVEAYITALPLALNDIVLQVAECPQSAERLEVAVFRRELARHGALHAVVSQYVTALLAGIMQAAVCNAVHTLHQRCCRWLLETADRAGTTDFRLTQEFLATMLGARRPTVTLITRDLQGTGLLRYTRGRIRIVDRQGLEARSCECYGAIKQHRVPLRSYGGLA